VCLILSNLRLRYYLQCNLHIRCQMFLKKQTILPRKSIRRTYYRTHGTY
jgi:hypothetical protein